MERSSFVDVTPAIAVKWLEQNTSNRRLDQARVNRYADMMRAGLWMANGESISFAENGRLLNGQHRLWAVVESQRTVRINVAHGVKDDCFATFDQVKGRTAASILSLAGKTNTTALASALVLLWQYERNDMTSSRTPPPPEINMMADINVDFEEAASHMSESRRRKQIKRIAPPSVLTFCWAMFKRQSETMCEMFFDSFESGTNLSQDSAVYWLRERCISNASSVSKLPTMHILALFIKAWNMYVSGKKCRQLIWRPGEAFPRIATT